MTKIKDLMLIDSKQQGIVIPILWFIVKHGEDEKVYRLGTRNGLVCNLQWCCNRCLHENRSISDTALLLSFRKSKSE